MVFWPHSRFSIFIKCPNMNNFIILFSFYFFGSPASKKSLHLETRLYYINIVSLTYANLLVKNSINTHVYTCTCVKIYILVNKFEILMVVIYLYITRRCFYLFLTYLAYFYTEYFCWPLTSSICNITDIMKCDYFI